MPDASTLKRTVNLPLWLAALCALSFLAVLAFAVAIALDRNPLPFPDRDYHVHSAASLAGLVAMEEVMRRQGHPPRFRADSDSVARTFFQNRTIINLPDRGINSRLGGVSAALGFVVEDPDASAQEVAAFLRERGFAAEAVLGAEPGLPIAFVVTDAMAGSALVFRKHMLRMGRKPDPWTPRTPPEG